MKKLSLVYVPIPTRRDDTEGSSLTAYGKARLARLWATIFCFTAILCIGAGRAHVATVWAQGGVCDLNAAVGEAHRFRSGPQTPGQPLDPDHDQIYYLFDWGDRQTTRVPADGFIDSTQAQETEHAWAADGSYTVSVRAFDAQDTPSEASNIFRVCVGTARVDALTGSQASVRADLNADNVADIVDLAYLLARWGTNDTKADLNKDGTVDILDYTIWLAYWLAKAK